MYRHGVRVTPQITVSSCHPVIDHVDGGCIQGETGDLPPKKSLANDSMQQLIIKDYN
jgi:hypothetical protein